MAPQEQDVYPPGHEPSDVAASETESDAEELDRKSEPESDRELLAEILAGVYRAEGMTAQGFSALHERLTTLEGQLGISADQEAAPDTSDPAEARPDDTAEADTFPEVPADADETSTEATPDAELPPMAQPVEPVQQKPQPVQPVQDVQPVASPQAVPTATGVSELEGLVFGQDFPVHESLVAERQAVLSAAKHGHENAVGLIGQLLIVRSATMDRLPTLLKDVGEAWYRWRGESRDPDPMRDALIVWLHSRLEAVGLGNRIDLVRVGDRFDSKRHNAKSRGVEVTGVQGWVVLRDNGNVYTKANVTVA